MEELSLLDNEELTLFIGSCLSLLFTCSFIYSYIKVFCHKLKFSDIPIIALSFCYFNNLVWYYYSDLIYHDYMKTCYSTSKTISFILIIIYLIYEFKEDKIDTFLNFGIIITVAWAIKKLLVDILNDEDKVKIACSFSQLSLITTIFEWIIRAYKEKNTNILNILCPIPLMSVSICSQHTGHHRTLQRRGGRHPRNLRLHRRHPRNVAAGLRRPGLALRSLRQSGPEP